MEAILIFFIAHWYLSLFSQSFFDHRYAAHGAFKLNAFWEKFFYVFSYITQGAPYMSPRAYAIMHRMHHAYTDTARDPHSPKYSKGVISMMKRTNSFYITIYKNTFPVEARFLKNVPDWPWFDKWALSYTSSVIWTLLYIGYYIQFAPSLWWYVLIPIHVLMGPVHGTIVNWIAHKYGYRNFELSNTSRNIMPIDIFMMGEGYHNNHHKFSSSANFGYRWYEIDPTYVIMRILHALHVLRINSTALERRVTIF